MKKILKMLFNRVVLVGLAILVQVLLLILMVVKFQEYFVYFYAMCTVLSMAVVLIIVNGNSNPGYKIAWLIPVLLVPVFGGLFYVIFGGNRLRKPVKRKMSKVEEKMRLALPPQEGMLEELESVSIDAANQARYIQNLRLLPGLHQHLHRLSAHGRDQV